MKRLFATLIASILVWACSDNESKTAGATSETTNGFAFRVVDAERAPLAMARVSLYSAADMVKLDSAVADSDGIAHMDLPKEDCYLEGIVGKDSALMAFEPLDTAAAEISLMPAATVILNYNALDSASWSGLDLFLLNTPYSAKCFDDGNLGECVFAHVPAGEFEVVEEKSVGEPVGGLVVHASAGDTSVVVRPRQDSTERDSDNRDSVGRDTSSQDTAARDTTAQDTTIQDTAARDTSAAFVFEDFDDGDSLNNFAKSHPNYGWYVSEIGDAVFTKPSSITEFGQILDSSEERGKYLSVKFDVGDSGMVLIGSHIGEDTAYFDMSSLTAIRVTLRGDGDVSFALEHFEEVEENHFNKALWTTKATGEWTEVEFLPGEEIVMPEAYQVKWDAVSKEIALFSIFMSSGTFLEVDKIEFVGVNLK